MIRNFFLFVCIFGYCVLRLQAAALLPKLVEQSTTLDGIVLAQDSTPLTGAFVFIPDLKLSTTTNSLGIFHFENLPAGTFLVAARCEGYQATTKEITWQLGSYHIKFVLHETAVEIDEVVVTGSSGATLRSRNPIPIVSISKEIFVTNLATNIVDAITNVPGIRAVTTGPNISKPFIRGLGYTRILTMYDGTRQEGQQWGDEHGIEIDQTIIRKVEVIKGPASLSYGSDALAGVVNFIPIHAAPEGKMIANIATEYQSNNNEFGTAVIVGATKNGKEWLVNISHKQAMDYTDRYDKDIYNTAGQRTDQTQRVFGTGFSETNASVALGIHHKLGYAHVGLSLYNDVQEIPSGGRDVTTRQFVRQIDEAGNTEIVSPIEMNNYNIEKIHQLVQHYRVTFDNNLTVGKDRMDVNIGFQRNVRREFAHPVLYTIPGLYLQLNTVTYDVKYHVHNLNNWLMSFGVNGMIQNNNVTEGTDFIIPSYKLFDMGTFFLVKKNINRLDIAAGMRYDIRSFNSATLFTRPNPITGFDQSTSGADAGSTKVFDNINKLFGGVSSSVGITYKIADNFSIKANIANGYRAPNTSEISANGAHPGTNIYQIGSANLKPELSLQEDIGAQYTSKFLVIEVSLFNNNIYNYIYNEKLLAMSGKDSIMVQGYQTFAFKQTRANLYGGEMNIDIHPIKTLHFENSVAMVYGANNGSHTDSTKYLPLIPPFHSLSELRLDFEIKTLRIKKGFVKIQWEYNATQNRVFAAYNTETKTTGYSLINAGVGGHIVNKKGKTYCEIYLLCKNLLDVGYQDHLNRMKYMETYPNNFTGRGGMYNMGRNISLKLVFPLSFNLNTNTANTTP